MRWNQVISFPSLYAILTLMFNLIALHFCWSHFETGCHCFSFPPSSGHIETGCHYCFSFSLLVVLWRLQFCPLLCIALIFTSTLLYKKGCPYIYKQFSIDSFLDNNGSVISWFSSLFFRSKHQSRKSTFHFLIDQIIPRERSEGGGRNSHSVHGKMGPTSVCHLYLLWHLWS